MLSLQVQSHDPNSSGKDQGFGYNIESSRQFQARGPLPPNPYGPGTGFDAFNAATAASSAHAHLGSLPYRNGSGYSHGHGSGPDTPRTSSYLSWSPPTAAYAESGAAEAQAQAQAGRISNGGNDNSSSGGHTSTYGQHNHHHHHPGYYHPAGISQPQEARFLSPFAFSSYTIAGHPSAAVVSLASLASRPSPVLSGPATIAGEHSGSFAYHQIAQAQALQTPAGEGSATSNAQGSTAAVSAASPGPSSESTSSTAAQQQQLLRNDSVSSLASYSRHTASPTASLQGATPSSSSYDNYSPSPISGYAHMTPGHDQSSSRSAELYTTSPRVTSSSESGTGFPSSLGGYVYHDTTAAAAIAAASHRRGTPENVGGRLSNSGSGVASSSGSYSQSPTNVNTSTSPFAMAAEMSEDDERKAPVSMRQ